MPLNQKNEEIAMLRTEIEMMMQERANLLRVAGAAARMAYLHLTIRRERGS